MKPATRLLFLVAATGYLVCGMAGASGDATPVPSPLDADDRGRFLRPTSGGSRPTGISRPTGGSRPTGISPSGPSPFGPSSSSGASQPTRPRPSPTLPTPSGPSISGPSPLSPSRPTVARPSSPSLSSPTGPSPFWPWRPSPSYVPRPSPTIYSPSRGFPSPNVPYYETVPTPTAFQQPYWPQSFSSSYPSILFVNLDEQAQTVSWTGATSDASKTSRISLTFTLALSLLAFGPL
jgi:hypothetical protein